MKKEVIAYERGYRISEDGALANPKGVFMAGSINRIGYRQFTMRHNGKFICVHIHRLQAFQIFGDRLFEPGILVRHLNGNPLDNSKRNIAIGTQSDNMMDLPASVRLAKALHATSFARKYDANEVQSFYRTHGFTKTLQHFNMSSKGTLHAVLHRKH